MQENNEIEYIVSDDGWRGRVAIVRDNIVVSILQDSPVVLGGVASDTAQIGDMWDPQTQQFDRSVDNKIAEYAANVQTMLDDFAKTRDYSSMLSACSYVTSTVEKFATEGKYCVDSRDSTWVAFYSIIKDFNDGKRKLPESFSDLKSELPTLEWPNSQ